jgi:hypothetical protein
MARVLDGIDDALATWIAAQHVFFVATAPLAADGHVNVSPKGFAGSFVVLGPHEVAYLDRIGSGAETIAHLRDNGRITIMFCAFDGKPNIVRLYGRGEVLLPADEGFASLAPRFAEAGDGDGDADADAALPRGSRAIVRVHLDRVSDSCGFGVPFMDYVGERADMARWVAKRTDESLVDYVAQKNATSIDGLPAVDRP